MRRSSLWHQPGLYVPCHVGWCQRLTSLIKVSKNFIGLQPMKFLPPRPIRLDQKLSFWSNRMVGGEKIFLQPPVVRKFCFLCSHAYPSVWAQKTFILRQGLKENFFLQKLRFWRKKFSGTRQPADNKIRLEYFLFMQSSIVAMCQPEALFS